MGGYGSRRRRREGAASWVGRCIRGVVVAPWMVVGGRRDRVRARVFLEAGGVGERVAYGVGQSRAVARLRRLPSMREK